MANVRRWITMAKERTFIREKKAFYRVDVSHQKTWCHYYQTHTYLNILTIVFLPYHHVFQQRESVSQHVSHFYSKLIFNGLYKYKTNYK